MKYIDAKRADHCIAITAELLMYAIIPSATPYSYNIVEHFMTSFSLPLS